MAVPNEYAFVQSFIGPRLRIVGDEEDTRANSFNAVNDGCVEIRKKDARWGLLIKTGGAQVLNRAADIWLYDLRNGTAQVVDIVSNAEGAPPEPGAARAAPGTAWQEKDIRNISEWALPYDASVDPGPGPGPDPGGADTVLVPTVAALEALEAWVANLEAQIVELRTQIANNPSGFPTRIALRSWKGRYLASEADYSVVADREGAGAWETWDVEAK